MVTSCQDSSPAWSGQRDEEQMRLLPDPHQNRSSRNVTQWQRRLEDKCLEVKPKIPSHLPPGSHELRGGGWGGQELQAPAQLRPPRAKASRAERAPGGSTARCIQPKSETDKGSCSSREAKHSATFSAKPVPIFPLPGQQWPQEPWRWGTVPCPSSLARWSSSNCP